MNLMLIWFWPRYSSIHSQFTLCPLFAISYWTEWKNTLLISLFAWYVPAYLLISRDISRGIPPVIGEILFFIKRFPFVLAPYRQTLFGICHKVCDLFHGFIFHWNKTLHWFAKFLQSGWYTRFYGEKSYSLNHEKYVALDIDLTCLINSV